MGRANHILIFSLMLMFLGCTEEEPTFNNEALLGRWEIKQATRNGKTTESMAELFFEFFADGQMATNLGGFKEGATYEVEDNIIMQRESQFDVDYTIKNLQDTTMELSFQLQDYFFKLSLAKSIPEE